MNVTKNGQFYFFFFPRHHRGMSRAITDFLGFSRGSLWLDKEEWGVGSAVLPLPG